MAAKTLFSLEQFMALPEDGKKYELNQGELVIMPPAALIHVLIVRLINEILAAYLREHPIGMVFGEAGCVLSREPEITYRVPDVSFYSKARLQTMRESEILQGAPDLAIEVVSPSNAAEELAEKVDQYLAAGSKEVWVFYPKSRTIQIHRADGSGSRLAADNTITSSLFPGWSARVADFFDLTIA